MLFGNGGASAQEGHCTAHEVWPGIFLGGYRAAMDTELLQREGITAILTAAYFPPLAFPSFPKTINIIRKQLGRRNWMCFELSDTANQPLLVPALRSAAFIDRVLRKKGRVLVHCAVGKSRSASMVIAYLILKQGLTYDKALDQLQSVRRFVQPNEGFEAQLRELEKLNSSYWPPMVWLACSSRDMFSIGVTKCIRV